MSHIELPPWPTRDLPMTTIGTRTIEDVIVTIDGHATLSPRAKSDRKSALRTIAKAVGHPPNEIPANPPAITRRLKNFEPAEIGLSPESWSNALSLARAAFRLADCFVAPAAFHAPLLPDWAALADNIENRNIRYGLSRFMHVASTSGWNPADVIDAHFDRYHVALEQQLACKDVPREDRRIRLLWNQAVRSIPGWPQRLAHITDRQQGYCFDWADFPLTLQTDVDAYLAKRSTTDLFSEGAPCVLATATLNDHRFKIRQYSSTLVRSGLRIERLESLLDLLAPEHLQLGFRFLLARTDGKITSQIIGIANTLAGLARFGHGLTERNRAAALATIDKVRKDQSGRPRFTRTGLTPKNKALLRQFDDQGNVAKIVFAADTLCEGLPPRGPLTVRQALAVRTAVMIELLLVFPIREKNLATLRMDRHFQWSRPGRQGIVSIYIQLGEVKNDLDLEVQLPDRSARLLAYYLEHARPVLGDPQRPWLFCGDDEHLHPRGMGEQFQRVIKRSLGLRMNMHFARHLCAKLYLDRYAGQFEIIRRALGHKDIRTTMKFYAEFSSVAALKLVDQNLLGLRTELAELAPRSRRRTTRIPRTK